ncbi:hypothetical protein BH09PAT1_BH09PAT1_2360 [soil metagenome]
MKMRPGRARSILESSIDSALLAVEIYNKPRTFFRKEGYITLMVMAWTKLLHADIYRKIGDKFYYKETNGKYKLVDGERKAWELKTCLKEIEKYDPLLLSEPLKANLKFFIGLRNKIEHRHLSKLEFENLIFGECQSLLYNYENILVKMFGEEYVLNENLAYALQFSQLRTKEQLHANKQILSKEVVEIRKFIEEYRTVLTDSVFNSQEYSIKLIQIPKISNTSRNDLAIEFVKWDELNIEDREKYEKLNVIIKDKKQ